MTFARKNQMIMNAVGCCSICFPLLQPPTTASPPFPSVPSFRNPSLRHFSVPKQLALPEDGSLRGRVGVHLALAAGHDDVYEAAGVSDTLLRAALGDLLLLLLLDLCCACGVSYCCFWWRCRWRGSDGRRRRVFEFFDWVASVFSRCAAAARGEESIVPWGSAT